MRMVSTLLVCFVVAGCRRESVPTDGGLQIEPELQPDSLSFVATGITNGSRSYATMRAYYDNASSMTIIETFDDSSAVGKFILSFRGMSAGKYRYTVTGGPSDTNHVSMKFVPVYNGGNPLAVFELTGIPADSLEATVTVDHYGDVGESISGSMDGILKVVGFIPPFKSLLHSGRFRVKRVL